MKEPAEIQDLYFSASVFPHIKKEKSFISVSPIDYDIFKGISLTSIVRGLAVSEEDFEVLMNETSDPSKYIIKDKIYYDVEYIRFCKMKDVTNKEWECVFDITKEGWCNKYKKTPITPVKIVKFNRDSLSLRDLNKYYKPRNLND